jgi:hypothetical protein
MTEASCNLVLVVTVLGAFPTFVLLEALIPRGERFGSGLYRGRETVPVGTTGSAQDAE